MALPSQDVPRMGGQIGMRSSDRKGLELGEVQQLVLLGDWGIQLQFQDYSSQPLDDAPGTGGPVTSGLAKGCV